MQEYYAPSIGDIRVGYECEILWNQDIFPEDSWYKVAVGDNSTKNFDLIDYEGRIANSKIRTPYLTGKQIELDGWEFASRIEGGNPENYQEFYEKSFPSGYFSLSINQFRFVSIKQYIGLDKENPVNQTRWRGIIPSINELRIISKLLGI